jgi:hypothetical protein
MLKCNYHKSNPAQSSILYLYMYVQYSTEEREREREKDYNLVVSPCPSWTLDSLLYLFMFTI